MASLVASKQARGLFCCCYNPESVAEADAEANTYQRFTDSMDVAAGHALHDVGPQQEQLCPSDFEVLTVLGRGTYGKVPPTALSLSLSHGPAPPSLPCSPLLHRLFWVGGAC